MGDLIYLNHAGTSWPKPEATLRAAAEAASAAPTTWPGLYEAAEAEVVEFFDIPERSGFLFTTSCTESLAVGLSSLPWQPGDRVITSCLEHHALVRPITDLARRAGVVHEVAPRSSDGGPMDVAGVEALLQGGGVRAIACSMASNVSGELLPIAELGRLARAHGAIMVVDAAQTAGVVPLSVRALDIDMLAFAGHKGPHAPQGIGGLYVAPRVSLDTPSASCDISAGPGGCGTTLSYCDVGSLNVPAAAGMAAGLRWIRDRGLPAVRQHIVERTQQLLDGLAELPGVVVHGTLDAARRTAAVSISVPRVSAEALAADLRARGIVTRGGHHCAPMAHAALGTTEHGTVRLSAGPLTTPADIDTALVHLRRLLR